MTLLKDQIIAACKKNTNLTSEELAKMFNRPRNSISAYISKMQRNGVRLEYNRRPNRIMTIELIEDFIEQGLTNGDIAIKLKVAKGSVENFIVENNLSRRRDINGQTEKDRKNAVAYGYIKGTNADEVWAQLSADAFRRNVVR